MTSNQHDITIAYHRSLSMSLTVALSFLGLAEEYEGFDQSVYSMYNALQSDLKHDIRVLFKPFSNVLLFDGLLQDEANIDTLSGFIGWIAQMSPERIHESNLVCLRNLADYAGMEKQHLNLEILQDASAVADQLLQSFVGLEYLRSHVDEISRLIVNPEELKATLLYIVTRFWDRHFKIEYPRWRSLEQHSIESLQQEEQSGEFEKDFHHITGRDYPESAPSLEGVKHAIFIPSCFTGPYLSVDALLGDSDTISVVYNCRPTGTAGHATHVSVEEVFAPLKALADETRLEILDVLVGRELYAQQIVDRMNISQSAVSRHLRLMVACGILRVRKQEGMKFYSINESTLSNLGKTISGIQGDKRS